MTGHVGSSRGGFMSRSGVWVLRGWQCQLLRLGVLELRVVPGREGWGRERMGAH